MKKIFCSILFVLLVIFSMSAEAEMKNFIGVGKYAMSIDSGETVKFAKLRAKTEAEKNVKDIVSIYITDYLKTQNIKFDEDKIEYLTNKIMNITKDVQYEQNIGTFDGVTIISFTATLHANIDTDDIKKYYQ